MQVLFFKNGKGSFTQCILVHAYCVEERYGMQKGNEEGLGEKGGGKG